MARNEPTPNPDDATPMAGWLATALLWGIVLAPLAALIAFLIWWAFN